MRSLLGEAVADTIGTIVTVPQGQMVPVVGAGLAGATAWNLLTWWFGLPSSSGHALVGGLGGAAITDGILSGYGGLKSVHWGGLEGLHPTGMIWLPGSAVHLAVAGCPVRVRAAAACAWVPGGGPPAGTGRSGAADGPRRPGCRSATVGNDAQKSMGVIAALLLASGHSNQP